MIDVIEQPLNEELKKLIYAGFGRQAIEMTGHDEKCAAVAFVHYDKRQFAGAVVVEIFWGALHIKYVYVEDRYRGKGLGSHLVKHALQYAEKNKCPFAFVETMSFQALKFYKKAGFALDFTRSGYKHGTSIHYLSKQL